MSTTESVLNHHLDAFGSQDMEATLEDYTDDSVVITPMGIFRGIDGITELFEGLFAEFEQPGVDFSLDEQVVEGEYGYIIWHAETPDNVYEYATDTFVIRDDHIDTQTFAGKITPKE